MNRGRAPSGRSYDSPRGRSSPSAGRFSPRNRHDMTGAGADGSYSGDSFSSRGGRSRGGRRGNANHMSREGFQSSSSPGPKMVWEVKRRDEGFHTEGFQRNQNASDAGDGDSKQLDSSVALDSAQSLAPSNSKGSQGFQSSSSPGPKMVWEVKRRDDGFHTEGFQRNQNALNAGDGDSKQLDSSVVLDSAQSLAPSISKGNRLDETEFGLFARSNSKVRQLDETEPHFDKLVAKGAVDPSTLHHNFSSNYINIGQIESRPSVQSGAADQPSQEQSSKSLGIPGDPEHSAESKQLDSSVALVSAWSLSSPVFKERQLDETDFHIDKAVVKGAADQPSREQCAKRDGSTGDLGHSDNSIKPFDICLPKTEGVIGLELSLHTVNREKRNADKRASEEQGEILEQGMVLLKGYLSVDDQVRIVKQCQQLGLGTGGFYQPGYRDGAKLNLKMMCLGKNWDPNTSTYGECRPDDGAKPPLIPFEFCQLVERAMKDSRALVERNSKGRNVENIIPWMSPDICIVNFYSSSGRLGLHQDKDESDASLKKGLPVVSFSIGGTGEFLYGDSRHVKDAKKVLLESGDVLIFGGKSRHIFHGVRSVDPETAPKFLLQETNLRPGRLNLTFRQY